MPGSRVWLWGPAHAAVGDDGGLAPRSGRGARGPVAVAGQAGPTGDCVVTGVVGGVRDGPLTLLVVLIQHNVGEWVRKRPLMSQRQLAWFGGGFFSGHAHHAAVSVVDVGGGVPALRRPTIIEGGDRVMPSGKASGIRGLSFGFSQEDVTAAAVAPDQTMWGRCLHPGRGWRGRGQDGDHVGGREAVVEWGGACECGGEGRGGGEEGLGGGRRERGGGGEVEGERGGASTGGAGDGVTAAVLVVQGRQVGDRVETTGRGGA